MSNFAGYSNSSMISKAPSNYTLLFPVPVTAILGFLSSVVSLATVAGNLLVITSFFVERTLRNATNYFIASLAVTDLLIGVFSMNFYTLYLLLNHWPLGELFCDLWLSLDYTACLTSQYTVFLITVDRFCSVHIPAKYRNWRTDEKVRVMVGITWIIPSSIFFTCILGWPVFTGDRGRPFDQCWAGFTNNALFNTILTIAYYWVTLCVMCGLYAGIYHVALNLQRKSDAKRRKMASLVSMTGQTMSRIGLTATTTDGDLFKNNRQSNNAELNEYRDDLGPKKSKKSKDTQKNKVKYTKAEERSSSPSFPSDSDNVSNTQNATCQKPVLSLNLPTTPIIPQSIRIESPVIVDDSPTPSETSPFNFFRYGNPKTAIIKSKFGHITRNKCGGAISAYSNDSDYQTSSGLSTDFLTEFRQINSVRYSSDQGSDRSHMLMASSDNTNIGIQFLDSNSFCDSRSKTALRLYQIENSIFPSTEGNSPVWIRRFDLSDDEERDRDISDSETFHEREPAATDTIVLSTSNKTEVVKASSITMNDNSSTLYRHISVNKGIQRQSSSFRINFRVHFSRVCNGIRVLVNVVIQRARSKTSREPKEIFERGRTENRARKALRTITLILGAFVICWTPYHVLVLMKGYFPMLVNNHLYNLSYWLCYANSPINPFCYALANAQFKKAFLRLLKGDFRRT